jgi:hypothetical protein
VKPSPTYVLTLGAIVTPLDICKLCKEKSELQNSHVIGNSIFKKIFRCNSGKAISISDLKENIEYSKDSWAEYQLCKKCETHLNEKYEKYSLRALRGEGVIASRNSIGVTFRKIDLHKLNMYFLSLVWRAANSGHSAYNNVILGVNDNEYLRIAILKNEQVPTNKFSIKISRLIDYTSTNGFSDESLKNFIVSPFCRINPDINISHISICFTFEGFFIEVFIPGLTSKFRNNFGFIHRSKKILVAPNLDIFSVAEIFNLLVNAYGKNIEGKSNIKEGRAARVGAISIA